MCQFVFAQTIITDKILKVDEFNIQYLYDADSSLTINEVARKEFTKTISSQFSMGYKTGSSWFKFEISNHSDNEMFILYLTEPFWASMDLYRLKDQTTILNNAKSNWLIEKNALNVPLDNRKIKDVNPAFALKIKKGETKTYFLEGRTVSAHIGEFQIFTAEEYYRPNRLSLTDFYIFYSVMLFFVMFLVSLLLSILWKKLYFYYVAYVTSFIIWISVLSGYYLSFGIPGWNEGLHAVGTILILFLVLFSAEFLKLKDIYPRINKLFQFSAGVIFLCGILISLKVPYVSLFFNVFSSLFFMLLFTVVIALLKDCTFNNLRFYFLALILYMPTMGMMTLTFNGLLDNTDITRYSFILGSFCEVLFFSLILASKFNDMKRHKLQLQNELLIQKQGNEQELEMKIEQRTLELSIMNQKLEEAKKELFKDSITDKLSNLYNRRYFTEVSSTLLNSSRRSNEPLSVLMLDIDLFKNVNDTYGHGVGDKVIVACANVLKEVARSSDVVTRYGGEEFVILLPDTDIDDALNLAHRIKDMVKVCHIYITEAEFINITISIGVTQVDYEEDTDIDGLIKRADIALYTAKKMGRNRVECLL